MSNTPYHTEEKNQGIGKFLQSALISFLTNGADSGFEITSAIHAAIFLKILNAVAGRPYARGQKMLVPGFPVP